MQFVNFFLRKETNGLNSIMDTLSFKKRIVKSSLF